MLIDKLRAARVGSGAEEGGRLDLLEGRLPRHRARTRAPPSSSRRKGKKGWFWYIPLHDDIISVGVVAGYDYLFKNRGTTDLEKIYFEEVANCPGLQPRIANATPLRHLPRTEGVLLPRHEGRRRRLGAGRRRLRLPRPALLVRRAARADVGGDGRRRHRRRAGGRRRERGPARQVGAGLRSGAWTACAGSSCEFYDGLSFGRLIRRHPDKKGLVTDVLIGDLFKDEVDELWPLIDEFSRDEAAGRA